MKKTLHQVLSVFLCFLLIISFYLTVASLFLQNTLFSETYYQRVTASPVYLPLVERSIHNDLLTQSNFVAIPLEHLQAGLDDHLIYARLRYHVQNTVAFLNFRQPFVKADYPADLFYDPLMAFIAEHAEAGDYEPSEEQYELLAEVAYDSAAIVERHINVVNLELVKDMPAFKMIHLALYNISRLFIPGLLAFLIIVAILAFMYRKEWRHGLLYGLISLWIAGALLAIPAVVTEIYGLTRRLAIETPYLKFAIDEWLTFANRYFLVWGLLILGLSTAGLVLRFVFQPKLKRKRHNRRHH